MTMSVSVAGVPIDPNEKELTWVVDIRVHNGDKGDTKSLLIRTDKPKLALDQAVSELKLMYDIL